MEKVYIFINASVMFLMLFVDSGNRDVLTL